MYGVGNVANEADVRSSNFCTIQATQKLSLWAKSAK